MHGGFQMQTVRAFTVGLLVSMSIALGGTLPSLTPIQASASSASSQKSCPPVSFRQRIPAPPAGFAAVITTKESANCALQVSRVKLVPLSTLALGGSTGSVDLQSLSLPKLLATATGRSSPKVTDPTLQGHSRTWDCCGILLTELDTTESWSYGGGQVLSANAQDSVQYKSENPPPGWYLATHADLWTAGCFGCFYVQLGAHAGFGYQGFFDNTGNDYYNDHYNYLTVEANGSGYCEFVVNWRKSLSFQHQNWCTGPY